MKRIVIWAVSAILVVLVLAVGAVTWYVVRAVRPARWALHVSPRDQGIAYEDVHFPSRDGIPLAGWWVPAKAARGTVILCHGYPANRADVEPMIPFLHHAGYNVLAFDFRRLGESGGDESTIGIKEPEDLHGAVDYARSRSPRPIGALGMSMGAAVCLMTAANEPRLKAVVADSSYTSLQAQVGRYFGTGAAARAIGSYAGWLGSRILRTSLTVASPLNAVPRIAPRPVLFIHGTSDRLIPDTDSEALFSAAGEPKEIWLAPGSRHVQAFQDHTAEYERRVLAFFRHALG